MKRLLVPIFCLASLAFALMPAQAAILYVPSAYQTIQAALTAAVSGDTIIVASGTYHEVNLAFKGKAVWLKSSAGAAATIIDGGGAGTVVVMDMAEPRGAILEGFTIQNGFVAANRPGGLYIRGSAPIIRNNVFRNNRSGAQDGSTGTGGAITIVAGPTGILARPLITGNSFLSNVSGIDGGAIYIFNSGADITYNTFTNNVARPTGTNTLGSGGAIQANRTPGANVLNISYNTFQGNRCKFAGGAVSVFAMAATVNYNQILNNDGGVYAGGIHLESQLAFGSFVYNVIGNTITGNTATLVGGGLHTYFENTTSVLNVIDNSITGNTCLEPSATSLNSPVTGSGGGIGCYEGKGLHTIRSNYIANNRADRYAGVLFSNQPLLFNKNRVLSNHARFAYGGMHAVGNSALDVTQNTFVDNYMQTPSSAVTDAGGLGVQNSTDELAVIANNVFDRNTGQQGGGLSVSGAKRVSLFNNTFLYNTSRDSTGGTLYLQAPGDISNNIFTGDTWAIRVRDNQNDSFLNNDFYQNTKGLMQHPTANYTNIATLNATTFAEGNLNLAPGFATTTSNNFHLTGTSPLINRGVAVTALRDIDNDRRPRSGAFDIGADEFYTDRLGLQSGVTFFLDLDGNFVINTADTQVSYGYTTDQPLTGDWNGDGIDTIGVRRAGVFYLRNSNVAGPADITFAYGNAAATAITGDWNGDGIDTVGVRSGNIFYLRNSNSAGPTDVSFAFGASTDQALVGDFDGNGTDSIAVRRGNVVYLKNGNDASAVNGSFSFGAGNELGVFGDWDGDGIDSLGLYLPSTGVFSLRLSNTSGSADQTYTSGRTGARPFAGIW